MNQVRIKKSTFVNDKYNNEVLSKLEDNNNNSKLPDEKKK